MSGPIRPSLVSQTFTIPPIDGSLICKKVDALVRGLSIESCHLTGAIAPQLNLVYHIGIVAGSYVLYLFRFNRISSKILGARRPQSQDLKFPDTKGFCDFVENKRV